MVAFFIDDIYNVCEILCSYISADCVVGIPMGTNYAQLVADLFLYSYEADFVKHLQKSKFKKPKM